MATSPFDEGLREGLREFGYIEGKTIVIEWRRSAGPDEELSKLAADLARSKVQVIVVYGTPATRAVLAATSTIPVVFGSGAPVESGLVPSLARPGGNATGVSVIITELTEKRLELLHQVAPRARRDRVPDEFVQSDCGALMRQKQLAWIGRAHADELDGTRRTS